MTNFVNIQKLTALFLALTLTLPLAACSQSGEDGAQTSAQGSGDTETTTAETQPEYVYPDVDYKGYKFKVLNYGEFFDCYIKLDLEEMTGEAVDDAVFARNRLVEQNLGMEFNEIAIPYPGWSDLNALGKKLQQSVQANDAAYDAAYIPMSVNSSLITDGYIMDLKTIPELQLDESWWDTKLNKYLEINGKLYAATSPLSLVSLGLTWVLLFNKDLMDSTKTAYPYDAVRSGGWTIDKMNEYVKAAASLNGADSFAYNKDAKTVYGIGGHTSAPLVMLLASGNRFTSSDASGNPIYGVKTEKLYATFDKLNTLMKVADGSCLYGNGGLADPGSYYNLFNNDRAMFLTTELKGTTTLRDMKSDYGILPFPKYDASQEDYISYASENIGRLVIPKTADDTSRTGTILDALSYESYKNVLPLYYGQTISQKGLRDEDSIDMLEIININRITEVGMVFALTTPMTSALAAAVKEGQSTAASIVAANEAAVKANIQKLIDQLK